MTLSPQRLDKAAEAIDEQIEATHVSVKGTFANARGCIWSRARGDCEARRKAFCLSLPALRKLAHIETSPTSRLSVLSASLTERDAG